MTTFAAHSLPLTLVGHENADELYRQLLGTRLLAVPCGNDERLNLWPGLAAKQISLEGVGWKQSAIDVVLSSAGTELVGQNFFFFFFFWGFLKMLRGLS